MIERLSTYWPFLMLAAILMLVLGMVLSSTVTLTHPAFGQPSNGPNLIGGLVVLGMCGSLAYGGWRFYRYVEKPRTNR